MRQVVAVVLAAAMVMAVGGCFESKSVLLVKKDGSGTITQTTYISKMPAMGLPGGEEGQEAKGPKMTQEQAEKMGAAMGEGVKLASFKELPEKDGRKGWEAVYDYPDVTKLKLSAMGGGMASAMGPGAEVKTDASQETKFEFTKGPKPKLTVITPKPNLDKMGGGPMGGGAPDAPKPSPEQEQMMMGMMKMFMKDMKVQLIVKVDGTISKTNATYVNKAKNGVWAAYVDFGGLVADDAAFKKMMGLKEIKDVEKMKEALKDPEITKHMMVETQEKVEIEFE